LECIDSSIPAKIPAPWKSAGLFLDKKKRSKGFHPLNQNSSSTHQLLRKDDAFSIYAAASKKFFIYQ
jgi:hypothetical protein